VIRNSRWNVSAMQSWSCRSGPCLRKWRQCSPALSSLGTPISWLAPLKP
jgi:hypothetical protein